ncbi:MAG: hypothetical protein QG564_1316 [Campylobacterota bacterium]|nr:hypothetical protein [Campylobacterota bacterium]
MRKIEVVKAQEVKIKPFVMGDFYQKKPLVSFEPNVKKKDLRKIAQKLGLAHKEEGIELAKKLLAAYIKQKK